MSDEQIIYLSPEEELTSVRERLERAQAKRIILVIPTQTQLRSHVSWKLLHTRARDLGKDVLVISSDRQIRSVVKTVGFKVADSQESSPSGGTRPGSRPSRPGLTGKTASRLHPPLGKPSDTRQPDPRNRQEEPPLRRPLTADEQRGTPPKPESRPYNPNTGAGLGAYVEAERSGAGKGAYVEAERSGADIASGAGDIASGVGGSVTGPGPATFDLQGKPFGPDYDFHIQTSPSIHPLDPEPEYDEANPLLEDYDYQFAQQIRQAAQKGDTESTAKILKGKTPTEQAKRAPSFPPDEPPADPFASMEDIQQVRLPEQRGSASIDELDDGTPDIADYPTDVIMDSQIEDLGDEGDFVLPQAPSPRPRGAGDLDPDKFAEPEHPAWGAGNPESPRIYGMRPRNNRQGGMGAYVGAERSGADIASGVGGLAPEIESDDELPPIPDQPTGITPPARPTGASVSSNRALAPQLPASARPGSLVPSSARTPAGVQRPARSLGRPGVSQSGKRPAVRRSRSNGRALSLIIALLFVLIVGGLAYFYFAPSADVTITIPSQSFSTVLKLTASATSQPDAQQHTVPAKTLVFETSVTGTGPATSTTKIGTAVATGNVIFTNKTQRSIHIPQGTLVATTSGVQFMTIADALAPVPDPHAGIGNTVTVPVQAQNPGVSGNVPVGSITVIPNPSGAVSSANLSVTNPSAFTNGGVGNATSVSPKDVETLKATLEKQLQQQVTAWLGKQLHLGDVQGKLVQTETPQVTPAAGQVAPNGSFTEHLSLHLTVLVVRAADLQAVATEAFNLAANSYKINYALVPQQTINLTKTSSSNCTPLLGPTALTLCYNATGQIGRAISDQQVRDTITGKLATDASDLLTTSFPGITNAAVTVSPGFFPWIPLWSQRINVHFNVVPTTPKK